MSPSHSLDPLQRRGMSQLSYTPWGKIEFVPRREDRR